MKLQSHSFSSLGRLDVVRRTLRSDFIRHGALVFASSTLVNIFNYLFHFAISRRLGVEGYGSLSALIAGLIIVSIPSTILTIIVVKYAAEFHALNDLPKLRTLTERVLLWASASAVVLCAVGVGASGAIANYLRLTDRSAVIVTVCLIAVNFVLPAMRGILQGVQDFAAFALSTGLEGVLKAMLGIALVYVGYGVHGALFGYLLGSSVGFIYTICAITRHLSSERGRLYIDIRRLVQTISGVALSTAALSVLGFGDVLLVKHFFSPQLAGLYGAVSLAGKVLFFVVGFVPTVVLPKASAKASIGGNAFPILLRAGLATLGTSILVLLLFHSAPSLVIRLLAGAAFAGAAPYVFAYALALAMLALTGLIVTYKISVHRFDFVPFLLVVTATELTVINFWHPTIWAVIETLLIGHSCAFLSSLYRVNAPNVATGLSRVPDAA